MGKTNTIIASVLLGTGLLVLMNGCGKSTADYVEFESVSTLDTELVDTGIVDADSTAERDSVLLEDNSKEENVYVYVCGAISKPGVYALSQGSRICDLFESAGGLTEDAACDYWNQAKELLDGEMIYVPTCQEVEERGMDNWSATDNLGVEESKPSEEQTSKININTATKESLMTLPGIGEAKALAILAYRQTHGAFSTIEELMEIEGIKEGVYSKIKDYIMVD